MKILLALFMLFPALAFAKECVIGGCSNQLCIEKGESGVSTCEWTAAYGCYGLFGECAELPDGKCGWKDKGSLAQCLQNPEEFAPQMKSGKPAIPEETGAPITTP